MINRVVLVGRLTKDPELRYTGNGTAVGNFTIAVNRTFTNAQGEREADFINVVVWKKAAENTANYVSKGSLVGVDGRLQTRSYDNSEGKRVYITEVVADSVQFLEPKKDSNGQNSGGNYQSNTNEPPITQNAGNGRNGGQKPIGDINNNPFANNPFGDPFESDKPIDISDDDLPF